MKEFKSYTTSIYILHIETATDICSVALSKDGQLLHHLNEEGTLQHARIITLMIRQLLKEATISINELSAVALSEGPGSYTSLRVGMSVAKGICYGREIPLIAVNTLEAIAIEARKRNPDADLICPMIDARRMEVYASLYDKSMAILIDNQPLILEPDTFDEYLSNGHEIIVCGNGALKASPLFKDRKLDISITACDARYLIIPAFERFNEQRFADIAYFSPNYIKSPNITQAKKKLL